MPPDRWSRRVWLLAGPIIVSNLSVPLVGAVDTAVVGHLPDQIYIGAVALGAVVFSFLYWGFGFLRMGTTGFVAQAHGAGNETEIAMTLGRSLLLAVLLGILVFLLQVPVARIGLALVEGTPALEQLAADYFFVRIWSAPATLANYALLGFFIGTQSTRTALALQLLLNGCNVVMDLVLVVGMGWGVEGVALASVISELIAAAVGVRVALGRLVLPSGRWPIRALLDTDRLVALLWVNANIFVRTLCLVLAFAHFTAMGTRLGPGVLAANAVLMHLQNFLAYGLDGFAHAAEALTGSAYGARSRREYRGAVRATTLWALLVAVAFTAVYGFFGHQIIGVLTTIPEVRDTASRYLPWLVAAPLLSVWSYQLDGVFIGTTRTTEMRNAMLISLLVYFAAVWIALPLLGNHGLWLALMIFMIARALTLAIWYPRIERRLV